MDAVGIIASAQLAAQEGGGEPESALQLGGETLQLDGSDLVLGEE